MSSRQFRLVYSDLVYPESAVCDESGACVAVLSPDYDGGAHRQTMALGAELSTRSAETSNRDERKGDSACASCRTPGRAPLAAARHSRHHPDRLGSPDRNR